MSHGSKAWFRVPLLALLSACISVCFATGTDCACLSSGAHLYCLVLYRPSVTSSVRYLGSMQAGVSVYSLGTLSASTTAEVQSYTQSNSNSVIHGTIKRPRYMLPVNVQAAGPVLRASYTLARVPTGRYNL